MRLLVPSVEYAADPWYLSICWLAPLGRHINSGGLTAECFPPRRAGATQDPLPLYVVEEASGEGEEEACFLGNKMLHGRK